MLRFLVTAAFCFLPAFSAVVRVNVVERADVFDGKPMGRAGAYERVVCKVYFAVDPANPANQNIRDLQRAPRNEKGLVEFSADLYVMRPRDPALGNGTLLVEVPNRGGRGMLNRFNLDDQFVFEQGYTLAWLGWQWDVPQREGLLRAEFPVLAGVTGPVRSEFVPTERTTNMPLADRNHIPYPVADTADVKLTVRDTVLGARRPVTGFSVAPDRGSLTLAAGFQPGLVYEAVYTASDPKVIGLGMAGFRDIVSYLRHDGNPIMVLGDMRRSLKRSIAFGISQSGRFLRTYLYYGMNTDEKNRQAFDAVWADVAGAGRGSFNHRFAQASRDGHPFLNMLYATDLPPFDDYGPNPPKVFLTNSSYEYWGRDGALVHSSTDGKADLTLPDNLRLYLYAGGQHGPGSAPTVVAGARYLRNPNDFRPIQRALLTALNDWLKDGKAPPASAYPKISTGELVTLSGLKFPKLPGVEVPTRPRYAYPLDFGPEFEKYGIVTNEPPKVGAPFALLVPQVDADGTDRGGVRMPEVAVPLGGYTGWNLRTGSAEIFEMTGSFFPFAKPRYKDKDEYLVKVDAASDGLIQQGFLLERDKARVREHAGRLWDDVQKGLPKAQ